MDQFSEVLDRLDVTLEDAFDVASLINKLELVLGRPPSILQTDLAIVRFNREFGNLQQLALFTGGGIDRFRRLGQVVFALRDRFGRFVATGIQNITRRLSQGSG